MQLGVRTLFEFSSFAAGRPRFKRWTWTPFEALGRMTKGVEGAALYHFDGDPRHSWIPVKFGCCPLRGLLYDNWHYIWSIKPELYDIQKDPGETENVVGQHFNVSQELHDQLQILLTDPAHDWQGQSDSVQQSETVERLQALGYVGGQPDTDTVQIDEGLEDPKDFVEIYQLYIGAQSDRKRGDWKMAQARCLTILGERPDSIRARILLGKIASNKAITKIQWPTIRASSPGSALQQPASANDCFCSNSQNRIRTND